MPRRKIHKILAKETDFYDLMVDELRLMNPQLVADFGYLRFEIHATNRDYGRRYHSGNSR